jgi:hypothetical protein
LFKVRPAKNASGTVGCGWWRTYFLNILGTLSDILNQQNSFNKIVYLEFNPAGIGF